MFFQLLTPLLIGQLIWPTMGLDSVNCTLPDIELTECGKISSNGCCAKGCVRNAIGRCVEEQCTDSWSGWLSRPVSMSCYFHWFLIIFAGILIALMLILVCCNLAYELGEFLRKRRQLRYVPFIPSPGGSLSSNIV